MTCDIHITFLESDSGLSVHSLLSDFMWVLGLVSYHWSSISFHFSKSTLTVSTRVRLLHVREQVGCRLPGREDPLWSHSHRGQGCDLLLSGSDSEPVTSVRDE